MSVDPILTTPSKRRTALPLGDGVERMYMKRMLLIQGKFWPMTTVKFTHDKESYWSMSKSRQIYYKEIMALFAPLDEEVNQNLNDDNSILQKIRLKVITDGNIAISAQEIVHSLVYAQVIVVVFGDVESKKILESAANNPHIKAILEWIRRYREGDNLAEACAMEYALEGILFQPAFVAIRFLANKGLMPGLTLGNDQISRDELDHAEWWGSIVKDFCTIPLETIYRIFREAVQLSDQFQEEILRKVEINGDGTIDNITNVSMQAYVRHIANNACEFIEIEPVYPGVENPYPETDAMSLNDATINNQFEVKSSQYSNEWDAELPKNLDLVDKWETERFY